MLYRELKNKSTGIDIIVPEYQVIPGKIVNTVLYHIIVITRLFYFKTRQHKDSDLVQFAVSNKIIIGTLIWLLWYC